MLGIEGNINAGSRQRQAEELALAWAVFDQEGEGCVTIYIGGHQQGMCRAKI